MHTIRIHTYTHTQNKENRCGCISIKLPIKQFSWI